MIKRCKRQLYYVLLDYSFILIIPSCIGISLFNNMVFILYHPIKSIIFVAGN